MLAIARNPEDELLSSLGTELSSNHTFHEDQPSTELTEPTELTHGFCRAATANEILTPSSRTVSGVAEPTCPAPAAILDWLLFLPVHYVDAVDVRVMWIGVFGVMWSVYIVLFCCDVLCAIVCFFVCVCVLVSTQPSAQTLLVHSFQFRHRHSIVMTLHIHVGSRP